MKLSLKFFIFLFITLLFSCSEYITKDIKLKDLVLTINFVRDKLPAYNHFFIENLVNSGDSYSFTIENSANDIFKLTIKEGVYSIYYFGLTNKTDATYMITSFFYKKNFSLNKNFNLCIEPRAFSPEFSAIKNSSIVSINIDAKEIYEFSYLSSISIKQGSDRYRSSTFSFDDKTFSYLSNIDILYNGDWYMNNSYTIRYKFDNSITKTGIKLSTIYLPDIFLGNF